MKLKKGLIIALISIFILAISNTAYAAKAVKNEVENTTIKNEVSNSVSNDTKSAVKNETKKAETKEEATKKETTISKKTSVETINEDVVNAESDENLEYKDIIVKGNMILANSDKITLTNVQVDGDVIAFANEVAIVDSEINGNVLTAADKVTIVGSSVISVYAGGEKLRFDEGTEIARELRVAGQTITINAEVGRDVYAAGETVKFGEDTVVNGKAVVRSENKTISEDAEIGDLDYKKGDTYSIVTVVSTENKIISYLISKGTELAIILVIALFILYGFPKFGEVNSALRLRDFFKAFFTGLLEFIIIIAIAIGLFFTIYGAGYGLILLNLLFTFLVLGKVIFVVSFAVRMSCNPEKASKVKAFFATVLVALILAVVEMISLAGTAGFIIDVVINCILAFTGLGSMFRVIFTSRKKLVVLANRKLEGKQSKVQEVPVAPVQETPHEEVVVSHSEEAGATELNHEVKAEIKEEVEELKAEREEEKKLDESSLEKTEEVEPEKTPEEPKEEPKQEEQPKEEKDEEKKDDKEDKKEE